MADGSISPHAGINFDPRAEFQWFAMSTRAGACKAVRIPTKPAMHSNLKPATCSDAKPAGIPI